MAQTLEDKSIWEDGEESLGEEVLRMSTDEIVSRTRLMDNEIKIMKSEVMRITHEIQAQNEKIKDNTEKIKVLIRTSNHKQKGTTHHLLF